jgi:hypothetical protein
MINFMTRVNWEARMVEHDGKAAEVTRMQLNADLENLVSYMTFADEVPLKDPIEGVSTFTKTFPQRGPRDGKGRSLREFDLQKRLFRYRLSYMIYSAQFDALPPEIRDRVYRRVFEKLAGLPQEERRAIVEIVRETKPEVPEYWLTARLTP